jgi:hypothetical protein
MRVLALTMIVAGHCTVAASQTVVIADGRLETTGGDVASLAGSAALAQATAEARAYWSAQDAEYEEEMVILDVAEGAFTESGGRQSAVLFVMSMWPRCCPKMGLALIENGRLLSNVAFEGSEFALQRLADTNGDGRDELVIIGEFGMGGHVSRSMTLSTFGPEGPIDLMGHTLVDSGCAASPDAVASTAYVVRAVDGRSYTVEPYEQPCSGGEWRSTGSPGELIVEPPNSFRYTALSGGTAPASPSASARVEHGRLEPGDATLTSGEWYDTYEARCGPGTLTADLRSTEFDPYLIIQLPDGQQLDNDDWEGDLTRSRLEAPVPNAGTCRVMVTSYQPGEAGSYEVTIGE